VWVHKAIHGALPEDRDILQRSHLEISSGKGRDHPSPEEISRGDISSSPEELLLTRGDL